MGMRRTVTQEQILSAIRAAAHELGRAPTREEFARMSGITAKKVTGYYPSGFSTAVREAGFTPTQQGSRVDTAALLEDWGAVARKLGRVPAFREYEREGKFGGKTMRIRFRFWSRVHSAFVEYVEGAGLSAKWADVLEMVRSGPIPAPGRQKILPQENLMPPQRPLPTPEPDPRTLPPQLWGKRRVTDTMLPWFVEAVLSGDPENTWSRFAMTSTFPRRVLPDRPVMGPPRSMEGLAHEPINEMGVLSLFSMLARRLGFVLEVVQRGYPDCVAKLEVEPGRWQHVRIELEYESRTFYLHRHDPEKCDIIVCWKHNWPECPEKLWVLELREVVKRMR